MKNMLLMKNGHNLLPNYHWNIILLLIKKIKGGHFMKKIVLRLDQVLLNI